MEGYIGGIYQRQLIERQGNYMLSSQDTGFVTNARVPFGQQPVSLDQPPSQSAAVTASNEQTGPVGPTSVSSVQSAHHTPQATTGLNHWSSARPSRTGTSTDDFDLSDNTTSFDYEYQATMDGRDQCMAVGDNEIIIDDPTVTSESTLVPPSHSPSLLDQRPHGDGAAPESYALGVPATSPIPSSPQSTLTKTFDTSSMSCSKAYAISGAGNQDTGRGPMIPQHNCIGRSTGNQEGQPNNDKVAGGYLQHPNSNSDHVQNEQLSYLLKAVHQLSADADSTALQSLEAQPEASKHLFAEVSQSSEARHTSYHKSPQMRMLNSPLTAARRDRDSSSQANPFITPPVSAETSPRCRNIDDAALVSQGSPFSATPDATPTTAYAALSPPKTPNNGQTLDLGHDLSDGDHSHLVNRNQSQYRDYARPRPFVPSSDPIDVPEIATPSGSAVERRGNHQMLSSYAHPSPGSISNLSAPEVIRCDVCGKLFQGNNRATRTRSLKRHKETEHGGEEYECVYCRERVKRSDYRVRHLESEKHKFKFPPTPKNRKRDPETEAFLQNSFRKVAKFE